MVTGRETDMRMTTKIALLLAGALSVTAPARADMNFCTEPTEPYCLSSLSLNLTDMSFNTCKMQVKTYLSEVDEYKECLVRDTKLKVSQQTVEANKVISKFNCIASGQSFCY
jgi:hypothetical protein